MSRNNRLPIETGYYKYVDNCDMQALGDEFHVLFICPFYSQVRNKYLKHCNQSNLYQYLDCLHYLITVTVMMMIWLSLQNMSEC